MTWKCLMNMISAKGIQGKYAERYHADRNLIRLDADGFPDAKSVNDALRTLGKIIVDHQKKVL